MFEFTDSNKSAVIQAIRNSTSIGEACAKAGVSVNTFNHWMAKANKGRSGYVEFRDMVEAAKSENPVIKGKSWNRKLKYVVSYNGETGSLASLAKKFKIRYNIVYARYLKHLSDPKSHPLTWVFRPTRQAQDSMSSEALQRDMAKSLASIAESLSRIADFCDRE